MDYVWAEFFMEPQETIIYRLVVRNLSNDAYFFFFHFSFLLAGKWMQTQRAPLIAWGLETRPKSWSTVSVWIC